MVRNNFALIALSLIFILLVTPEVLAIGLSPAKIEINYEEPIVQNIDYIVSWDSRKSGYIGVELEGALAEFGEVSLEEQLLGQGQGGKFSVLLDIPKNHGLVGKQVMWIKVSEIPESAGQGIINVLTAVRGAIVVYFPYPGKYLEISEVYTENINEGEDTATEWSVRSRGEELTSFSARLEVIDEQGDIKFEKDYPNINLAAGETYYETEFIRTSNYKAGPYKANLTIKYDDEVKFKASGFMVGQEGVELKGYSPKEFIYKEVNKLTLTVSSLWNGEFKDVYAEIDLAGISTKTPSQNLNAFESIQIEQFIDSRSLEVGSYNGTVTLFFDGNQESFPIGIVVKEPIVEPDPIVEPENSNSIGTLTIVLIVLVVILVAGFIVLFLKNKKKEKPKTKKKDEYY